MSKSKFAKTRKAALAALCALSVTCTGLAAACAPADSTEDPSTETTSKEDVQLLKNGNFEFSEVPDKAVHIIKNVNNWSRSGDSSGAMSGIINTSSAAWDLINDSELKDKLEANNLLSTSDPDYEELHVDYNGMDSDDIPYADTYAARMSTVKDDDEMISLHFKSYQEYIGVEGDSETGYTLNGKTVYRSSDENDKEFYYDSECTDPVRFTRIANPETHLGSYADGKLGSTPVWLDDDGNYYLDEDKTQSTGNVLMVHNYPTNAKYNGIEQHYASQSVTIEANTAAEISLWVKTSNLRFDKGNLQINEEDRGAYIEVNQTIASTTIDSFKIRAINTEKIIADNNGNLGDNESNGWLKYTIYVNGCDFSASTITLNLGLGDQDNSQKVTGYAFFDDVEVKKFIDLNDEGCTYSENADKLMLGQDNASYCSLTSEKEDKIFIADRQVREGNDERYSKRFYYLVDLASDNANATSAKNAVPFSELETNAALTTEDNSGKVYASALSNEAKVSGFKSDDKTSSAENNYALPDGIKQSGGRPTANDLLGIYDSSKNQFSLQDFNSGAETDYSNRLNSALTGDKGLKALSKFSLESSGSMLVMLSSYGAAYTATLSNNAQNVFTVAGNTEDNHYKIISFWIKTSDMAGKNAATVKIIAVDDEDNFNSVTVDTTNVTTDVGDSKDIYNGWVQCFFFVENDTEEQKEFKIEFSFGNTELAETSGNAYYYGWSAIANMQTIDVNEDVFKLTSDSSYSKILTFGEDEDDKGNAFDEANRMTNVKNGVANPSNYNGVNGGSSYVSDKTFGDDFDKQNNSKDAIAGLINRDSFDSYANRGAILSAFKPGITDAIGKWNEVFGEDCYQPLIIVNQLRRYRDTAEATEDTYKNYYVLNENGEYVTPDEWDENETYYSVDQLSAVNYGFIGNTQSVSESSYTTVSVRVMVSGDAVAYVYLVDPSTRDVLSFNTPDYTFYYDPEGNVLNKEYDPEWEGKESEHTAAIVYKVRDDGLYEDKDGKVFANLYNLTKKFKYAKYEGNNFYTADGEYVSFDDLEDLKYGENYYSDKEATRIAEHYLCVDQQRIFEYDPATDSYYYLVNGERGVQVNNFEAQYARYSPADKSASPEYVVKVENTDGKWVTVNFIIHTGNISRDYRLELWSGKRNETGYTDGMTESDVSGAVAFDYSSYNISESNYSNVLEAYESAIIDVYKILLADKNSELLSADYTTIADYEKALGEAGVTESEKKAALEAAGLDPEFSAQYYSFTLYDSAQYVPFNLETAESGQTGYDYSITDDISAEKLVYFTAKNKSDNSYNTFIDYSAVDQTVEISTTADSEEETEDENSDDNGGNGWLLITSIILVVVLLFALIAILVRYLWKKHGKTRGQKELEKNNYKKRERYIRKLKLVKNAPIEDEEPADVAEPDAETPAESDASEQVEETPVEQTEQPETETPAESESPEQVEETPVEQTEQPADDGNKEE